MLAKAHSCHINLVRKFIVPLAVAVSFSNDVHSQALNCERIERVTDPFSGKVTLSTNLLRPIAIIREATSRGKAIYYVRITATGTTIAVDGKGAYVLFSDGTRWSRAAKIDVDAGSGGFEYSAFIQMTAGDLKLFSTKPAARVKLYIFESDVGLNYAEDLLEDARCMSAM